MTKNQNSHQGEKIVWGEMVRIGRSIYALVPTTLIRNGKVVARRNVSVNLEDVDWDVKLADPARRAVEEDRLRKMEGRTH